MTYPGNNHPLPPLISIAMLETHMGMDPGELDEGLALQAIHGASGAVRDVCGWRLDYEEVEGYQPEGDGSSLLTLPTTHLVSVERVEIDGEEYEPYTSPTTSYRYSVATKIASIRLAWPYRWPQTQGRIEIDFSHGWELTHDDSPGEQTHQQSGLPTGLEGIILSVAERGLEPFVGGLTTVKVGQVTESRAGSNLPMLFIVSRSEEDQLAPYRLAD